MALSGLGALAASLTTLPSDLGLALPFALLALNLAAAVATNGVFRRQTPLLIFHVALLVIVLLAAVSRLTYLNGRAEVLEGEPFTGELVEVDAGAFHPWRLERAAFINRGFTVEYREGLRRGPTRNRVEWIGEDGRQQIAVIGDTEPLRLAGYRFYTTPNKGFAPTFVWQPAGGRPVRGAVHLPSYPLNDFRQAREWTLPGLPETAWVMLKLDGPLIDPARAGDFRLPDDDRVVLRVGDRRAVLRPGERLDLPEGSLMYTGLRTWMGYSISFDWTAPWMLASALLALASLGWHYMVRFSRGAQGR